MDFQYVIEFGSDNKDRNTWIINRIVGAYFIEFIVYFGLYDASPI